MGNNGGYRFASQGVEWHPTKYDGFHLVKTEHPHRCQTGSGRTECFKIAEDGLSVGEWTKRCAEAGYAPKFVVGSLLKLMGAKLPGWTLSSTDDDGKTLSDLKSEREVNPDKAAAKAEAARIKAEEREARAAAREAKRAEVAAERKALAKDDSSGAVQSSKPRKGKKKVAVEEHAEAAE